MKEVKLEIKLPETVTVHIPSFSNISMEDVINVLAKDGVNLIKETVKRRVLEEFVKRHESYIQEQVSILLDEKSEEITKLLNK